MKNLKAIRSKLYYFRAFSRFKKHGNNIILSKNGHFIRPEEIEFGSNIFISRNFYISARNLVLGSNIMIGPNLVIECDNHAYKQIGKTMFSYREKRIVKGVVIEDDVWMGANVTLLPGARIGEGAIIGAGSIVNKEIPPYSICVGIPCKPIKKRFNNEELSEHLKVIGSKYRCSDILISWENYFK